MLELVIGFFGEGLLEVLLELGLAGVKEARGRENWHPALATLGYLILGGLLGGLSLWLLPQRMLHPGPLPGTSLVLSPVGAGVVMELWGQYRRAHGHATTNLATWYGGGALALGVSLVRVFGVR